MKKALVLLATLFSVTPTWADEPGLLTVGEFFSGVLSDIGSMEMYVGGIAEAGIQGGTVCVDSAVGLITPTIRSTIQFHAETKWAFEDTPAVAVINAVLVTDYPCD